MTLARCILILLTGLLFTLTSCFWGSEFREDHIIDKYYASGYKHWHEPMSAVYLYFEEVKDEPSEPLVPKMLEAIGANEKCVIMKSLGEEQYYIARILAGANNDTARKNVLGPFDKTGFHQKLKQINGGTALPFTYHYQML